MEQNPSTASISKWETDDSKLVERLDSIRIHKPPETNDPSKSGAAQESPRVKRASFGMSVLDVQYIRAQTGKDNGTPRQAKSVEEKPGKKKKSGKKKPSKKQLLEMQELAYEKDKKLLVKTYKLCCQTLQISPDSELLEILSREPDTKRKESWLMDHVLCVSALGAAGSRAFVSAIAGQWVLGSAPPGKVISTGFSHLKSIELRNTNLGEVGTSAIAGYLLSSTSKSLEKLQLIGAGIMEAGAHALGNALRFGYNRTLRELYIFCDKTVGDDGAVSLCRGIGTNSSLKSLSIIACGVQERGAGGIASVLGYTNSGIESLNIRGNEIGGAGLRKIAKALKSNKTLKFLNVANIGIYPSEIEPVFEFGESIIRCESLNAVNFNYNPICDVAAEKLGRLFEEKSKESTHLKQFVVHTDMPAHLFQLISRNKSSKGKKGRKKKKRGGGADIPPILPDLYFALQWLKKIKEEETEAEKEEGKAKKGSKGKAKKPSK